MANIQDLLKTYRTEEDPMMSEMSSIQQNRLTDIPPSQSELQEPLIPNETPQEQVFTKPKLTDILPAKSETPMLAEAETLQPSSEVPTVPMSRSEALLAEYQKMLGKDQESLAEARKSDRMLKVGGAIGDALATYLNARSQMSVKAPGVQVQQGAGLGKIADMFATAPEIASDVAARRENLMKQYAELARGERTQARLSSEEKRASDRMTQQERMAKAENEAMLQAAAIRASRKGEKEFTPYQEKMIGEKQEDNIRRLGSDITKSGLPRLTKSIKELENQLGMPLETALERNTDEDKENDVNIPGYGRLASLAPDWSVKENARAFRQGVQSVLNPDISKQYGATQSTGEIERYQKQVGGGTFEDQNAVLRGLAAIKGAAKADLDAITAGYKPETVQTYQERKGVSLENVSELDPRVESFMKKNNITDKDEAIRILKENGKL